MLQVTVYSKHNDQQAVTETVIRKDHNINFFAYSLDNLTANDWLTYLQMHIAHGPFQVKAKYQVQTHRQRLGRCHNRQEYLHRHQQTQGHHLRQEYLDGWC